MTVLPSEMYPDEQRLLADHEVDIEDTARKIAKDAYDELRREPSRSNLTDDEIAKGGWCEDLTIFITQQLQTGIQGTGLSAFAEAHFVDANLNGKSPLHYYTTLSPDSSGAPNTDDIVVDATYLQYLDPQASADYPLVFVGTRTAMMELMEGYAVSKACAELYDVSSYNSDGSSAIAEDWNLPRRI